MKSNSNCDDIREMMPDLAAGLAEATPEIKAISSPAPSARASWRRSARPCRCWTSGRRRSPRRILMSACMRVCARSCSAQNSPGLVAMVAQARAGRVVRGTDGCEHYPVRMNNGRVERLTRRSRGGRR